MDSRLFVTCIDDADAFTDAAIVYARDMPATEGEDDLDSFTFEDFGDQPAAVYYAHWELLVGCFLYMFSI